MEVPRRGRGRRAGGLRQVRRGLRRVRWVRLPWQQILLDSGRGYSDSGGVVDADRSAGRVHGRSDMVSGLPPTVGAGWGERGVWGARKVLRAAFPARMGGSRDASAILGESGSQLSKQVRCSTAIEPESER